MRILVVSLVLFSLVACKKEAAVGGKLADAAGKTIYLEEVHLRTENYLSLGKTEVAADGSFKFAIEQPLEKEKLYAFKVDQVRFLWVNDVAGPIYFEGNLAQANAYSHTVKESKGSQFLVSTMKNMVALRQNQGEARNTVAAAPNTYSKMMASLMLLSPSEAENFTVFEKVGQEFKAKYPGSVDAVDFDNQIAQYKQMLAQNTPGAASTAAGPITVGQMAPDIALPDPSGKLYKLSDLKGKVVLLDFWASWCGPCRRSNPALVKLYNKNKSKGFEVFSVSMDGVAQRNRAGMEASAVDAAVAQGRSAWTNAIKKDGLVWPYHVSDLLHWDAAPAQIYGVRSIPQAFVINKEGKIAAILQPGQSPDAAVEKLL